MCSELYQILEEQLERHEGLRLKPYRDTVGKLTIGIGRNLDDVGISEEEARAMLKNDIDRAKVIPAKYVENFASLPKIKQAALINMCFNLGERGFSNFRRMIAAISAGEFETAAAEMLNSRWATQVGNRANELANIMRA
jgi:lysozyme